jgi:hypothetical protein
MTAIVQGKAESPPVQAAKIQTAAAGAALRLARLVLLEEGVISELL